MTILNSITGVRVAAMSQPLHVSGAFAAAAHPAAAAAAITPRKPRTGTAIGASVTGHHLARAPKFAEMATDPQSPDPWP